jgi:hypothetical protein
MESLPFLGGLSLEDIGPKRHARRDAPDSTGWVLEEVDPMPLTPAQMYEANTETVQGTTVYNCLTELYNQSLWLSDGGPRMMEKHRITVPAMRRKLANAFLENSDLFSHSWGDKIKQTVQSYNYQPEDYPQAAEAYATLMATYEFFRGSDVDMDVASNLFGVAIYRFEGNDIWDATLQRIFYPQVRTSSFIVSDIHKGRWYIVGTSRGYKHTRPEWPNATGLRPEISSQKLTPEEQKKFKEQAIFLRELAVQRKHRDAMSRFDRGMARHRDFPRSSIAKGPARRAIPSATHCGDAITLTKAQMDAVTSADANQRLLRKTEDAELMREVKETLEAFPLWLQEAKENGEFDRMVAKAKKRFAQ